jgi:hypothetical protein
LTVLVVTGDVHGEAVFERLAPPKAILRTERPYSCSVLIAGAKGADDAADNWSFQIAQEGALIDIRSVTCAYIRRPTHVGLPTSYPLHVREFLIRERETVINAIAAVAEMLPGRRLYWQGRRGSLASNKIVQLIIAQHLGLHVPTSCITNIPDLAKEFYERNSGSIIFKCMGPPVIQYSDGRRSMIYTSSVTNTDFSAVSVCPSLFQEKIRKECEFRIAVIGQEVFPIKIDSQRVSEGVDDWRKIMRMRGIYSLGSIPTDVERKLVLLHQALGIKWGMVDMALDALGNYVFFETNPDGAWLWLEQELGEASITERIATMLAGDADNPELT